MNTNPEIKTEILQLVTSEQAYYYRIVPFKYENDTVSVFSDKNDEALIQELTIVLNKTIAIKKKPSEEIEGLLHTFYRKLTSKQVSTALVFSEDFLLKIIHEAKEIGSSDIHFEPFDLKNRVRFRIDGKLIERYVISNEEYPKIINRLKIMGGLDISEKRLPQDGRISIKNNNEDFDIRVSSLPVLSGEKLVLRILSKNNLNFHIDSLGFSQKELALYKKAISKPNGIILISGPTGSGKTTTLYATLKLLNTVDTNVLTIEDPIEYTLEGVNQVQLKESIGLNFASTLRTFLRQDPDVIMVGEIRDKETANMAIRASLTGHLVLSTIHTNSAWGTISRLSDMGIPPFLIASTLNISVAQRLVRKLCNSCKKVTTNTTTNLPELIDTKVYTASGCEKCHNTGYKGRKAIYELIPITQELVEAINDKKQDIKLYLKEKKIVTLKDNALNLVKEGVTSIEEIYPYLI